MLVPNKHGTSHDYRFGFQGQEMDNELKGDGNSLNYTFRMHDPRVGRFFAIDPLASKYPFYSPYQFSGNRVVDMVELEGLEPAKPGTREGEKQSAVDQEAVKNNDYCFSDLFTGDKLYGDWFWHAGTATTKADWYKTNDYKAVVMPFAVDMAKFAGWSYGTDWKSAKDLISNPGSGGAMSERLKNFISSRVFDSTGGDALNMLTQIGASQINSANKALAGSASGAITPMEIDSPFFGLGLGLKGFATGSKAASEATFGVSISDDYRKTFFTAYPELEGQVVVHHAVEQQVLTRYNIVTKSEIHSFENLRGIPNELNSSLHLSDIRIEWNKFYRTTPNPTKQMLLDKATEIDNVYGSQFLPKR